jgi:membrane protein implicated in regulation of membrane protease activity
LEPVAAGQNRGMILLGLILLILGLLFGIGILYTIGIVLIIVGAVLWLLGSMNRAVGGRRHYW